MPCLRCRWLWIIKMALNMYNCGSSRWCCCTWTIVRCGSSRWPGSSCGIFHCTVSSHISGLQWCICRCLAFLQHKFNNLTLWYSTVLWVIETSLVWCSTHHCLQNWLIVHLHWVLTKICITACLLSVCVCVCVSLCTCEVYMILLITGVACLYVCVWRSHCVCVYVYVSVTRTLCVWHCVCTCGKISSRRIPRRHFLPGNLWQHLLSPVCRALHILMNFANL